MKPEVTLKYLSYLQSKKQKGEGGFTLIELLVVVIIIGVLAAVALPNLLGQVGKARETEGKNGTGSINRAQQAYHFERQNFATGVDVTSSTNGLGVVVVSDYYSFPTGTLTGNAAASGVQATATDGVNDGVRTFAGGVFYAGGQYTSVLCQSDAINVQTIATGASTCTNGTSLQ